MRAAVHVRIPAGNHPCLPALARQACAKLGCRDAPWGLAHMGGATCCSKSLCADDDAACMLAGVDEESVLRVRRQGDAGQHGGQAGDLYITFAIRPASGMLRQGLDLFSEVTGSLKCPWRKPAPAPEGAHERR